MVYVENDTTELKRQYTDEIKRTVVAFANTNGGEIYIGIENDGQVVGVENSDAVCLRAVNSCRNSISPDITMFIKVEPIVFDGKSVVRIAVLSGSDKPYYIRDKGLKPTGVMIRVGSSTVPATEEHIRTMIKLSGGDNYVEGISVEQELTFKAAKSVFEEKGIAFGKKEFVTLGLLRSDGRYSNLALLLSDQCKHTIKVAIFEGTTKSVFRDRKEIGGSLFTQLEEVFRYIDFYNKTHASFKGLTRIDKRDYPENAIREALLNAIIHREYSFSGSILVNLYDDRFEVVSLGGIVPGLTIDAILSGISQTRNEKLANVFYRLNYVEAYGTGIPRILETYSGYIIKPTISATDSSFSIVLPNMNYASVPAEELSSQEQNIFDIVKNNPAVTRKRVMELTNLGSTRVYNILTMLAKSGLIIAEKDGRETTYTVK